MSDKFDLKDVINAFAAIFASTEGGRSTSSRSGVNTPSALERLTVRFADVRDRVCRPYRVRAAIQLARRAVRNPGEFAYVGLALVWYHPRGSVWRYPRAVEVSVLSGSGECLYESLINWSPYNINDFELQDYDYDNPVAYYGHSPKKISTDRIKTAPRSEDVGAQLAPCLTGKTIICADPPEMTDILRSVLRGEQMQQWRRACRKEMLWATQLVLGVDEAFRKRDKRGAMFYTYARPRARDDAASAISALRELSGRSVPNAWWLFPKRHG